MSKYYSISGRLYPAAEVDQLVEVIMVELLEAAYTQASSSRQFTQNITRWKNSAFAKALWGRIEGECIVRLSAVAVTKTPKNGDIFYRLEPEKKLLTH